MPTPRARRPRDHTAFEAVVRAALEKHGIVALPPRAPYTREGLRLGSTMPGAIRLYMDAGGRDGRRRQIDKIVEAFYVEGIRVTRLDDDTVVAHVTGSPERNHDMRQG